MNLAKLIGGNKLMDFVKSNTQSRLFQDYLGECGPAEIAQVIAHVRERVVELVTHEYGNYMVQKLFTVCSASQRVELLQVLAPQLGEVVRNKQGTHTVQAFISHFSLPEEFGLLCSQLTREFYELSCNNNATHFVQKVIKTFPLEWTLPYFSYTA